VGSVLGVRLAARPCYFGEGGQLLAHAFVAGILGEDAFEVLPRLRLLPLIVLGAFGQGQMTYLRRPRARAKSLLQRLLKVAKRWRLVSANVLEDVDRPRLDAPEMNVLDEAEVSRLLTAYRELALDPPEGTLATWWALARRIVTLGLTTALRRGELLALRWRDVELLEGKLSVREAFVRGEFQAPNRGLAAHNRARAKAVRVLQEHWAATSYKGDDELVFGHPEKGTPLDPSKLGRDYMRPALKRAKITKPFRTWHDLRHTALTHEAAAGNPGDVQLKAGHSQGSITERYLHAAQVLFPGAAAKGEERLFGSTGDDVGVEVTRG
jgi:integrase